MDHNKFKNRIEASRELSNALSGYKGATNTIVLALPRGGVPVAHILATNLNLPLDLLIVRKLGAPHNEELAIGALSLGNVTYLNKKSAMTLGVTKAYLEEVIEKEKGELERRNQVYRQGKEAPDVKGKNIILVDDGIATGATMYTAVMALKQMGAGKITVASPICSLEAYQSLKLVTDEIVCLKIPKHFYGVGMWYENFEQTGDQEVLEIMKQIDN